MHLTDPGGGTDSYVWYDLRIQYDLRTAVVFKDFVESQKFLGTFTLVFYVVIFSEKNNKIDKNG